MTQEKRQDQLDDKQDDTRKVQLNVDDIKNYHLEIKKKLNEDWSELVDVHITPQEEKNWDQTKNGFGEEKGGNIEKTGDSIQEEHCTQDRDKEEKKEKLEDSKNRTTQQTSPLHNEKQQQNDNVNEPATKAQNLQEKYRTLPTVIMVIGMAGSGKTTYVGSLYKYLKRVMKKKVYTINLDPAVQHIHYPANIDIRESIKYHTVMKEFKLGPNGAIMTCLNLFATRFDKVLELLEKRKDSLNYIIVDTPGQIEVFNWSASGTIILETLAVAFPVIINYVVDTVRCERPVTFMSNMLYACSVLYKSRLPFLACFNKIDVMRHDRCIEWMRNFDSFNEDVLNDTTYMATFSRSCALMLNEFYENIKTVGLSSKTQEGFNDILKHLEDLKQEYMDDYLPRLERQARKIRQKKEKETRKRMAILQMSGINAFPNQQADTT